MIFMKKKAVIYTRVSLEKQAEQGISLEAQLSQCEKYADLQNWEVVGTFKDEGISGKTTDRDGLQEALKAVKKNKGVLVIYSLSRLSRSVLDTLNLVEELQNSKADLASVSENIDTAGPCGRFQLNVMSAMNQLEREQTSQRTKMAMAHLKATGKRFSRHAPYGFSYVEGKMVENKDEQEVIRYVKELREKGNKQKQVLIKMELKGMRNRKGNSFSVNDISRMVRM